MVEEHARFIVRSRSAFGTGGGLHHVTFVESDFDRLWNGIERGDILGTAYSVLPHLGPGAEQFVARDRDFILFDEGAVIAALQASGLLIKCF
jgi:hypothetical protein